MAVDPSGHLFSRVSTVMSTSRGHTLPLSAPAAAARPQTDTPDPSMLAEGWQRAVWTPGPRLAVHCWSVWGLCVGTCLLFQTSASFTYGFHCKMDVRKAREAQTGS